MMPLGHAVRPTRERFEDKYIPEPNTGCFLWFGATGSSRGRRGYGNFSMGGTGTTEKAHRASWRLYCGEVPAGLHVLHKCDNPSCVNPDHLFLGTNADNMADRDRKGRVSKGANHYTQRRRANGGA